MKNNYIFLISLASFIPCVDSFAPHPLYYSSKAEDDSIVAATAARGIGKKNIQTMLQTNEVLVKLHSVSPKSSSSAFSDQKRTSNGDDVSVVSKQQSEVSPGTDKVLDFFKNVFQPLQEVPKKQKDKNEGESMSNATTTTASSSSSSSKTTPTTTGTTSGKKLDNQSQGDQDNSQVHIVSSPPDLDNKSSVTYSSTTSETSSMYNAHSESSIYTNTYHHSHEHLHRHNHNHNHTHYYNPDNENVDKTGGSHDLDQSSNSSNEQQSKRSVFNWSKEESSKSLTVPSLASIEKERQEHEDRQMIPKKSSEQILLEQTLEHQAFTYGPTNIETMKTLHNLATYMYQHSKHEKEDAIKLLAICYQQQKTTLHPSHEDTILSMNNLARIHANEGQYELARDLIMNSDYLAMIQSSRETYLSDASKQKNKKHHHIEKPQYQPSKKNYNKDDDVVVVPGLPKLDERILDTLVQLAFAYHREGIVDESIELYETYLSHYSDYGQDGDDGDDKNGDNNDDNKKRNSQNFFIKHNQLKTSAQQNLAILYQAQGDFDKAIPLIQECYTQRQIILGKDHQLTLGSMNNLAALFHKTGKYEKAMTLYSDCLELKKKSLGKDHPDTKLTSRNLDRLKQSM